MADPLPRPTAADPRSAAREPPAWLRYGVAVAATAAALGVTLLFPAFVAPNVFIFFFVAVVVSAWYGGAGPALVVIALAVPLVSWFVLPPRFAWATSPEWLLRIALFAAVALLIGRMRRSLSAARVRAEEHARDAEFRAEQLEDQAAELEQQAAELQEQATELELRTEEAQNLAGELEEAYRQLEESSARQLAEAQALAHVGSWEWSVADDRVKWSDEMYRVYGLEPGAVPVTLASFLDRVHPADRDALRATVERAATTGEPFELDHRVVHADGRERMLHARGRAERGPDGRVARMVGTGQDVTEARAAEDDRRAVAAERAARAAAEEGRARLESILQGIGEAFLALDAEWRCTWVNGRAEHGIGRPRGELVGRVVWELFPELVHGPVWEAAHAVRGDGKPREVEFESGGRWFAVRLAPWEGGVSVFYRDVTGRRRAQEERARLAAIVEGSEDAIFAKSLDGVILTWNRGAQRLYGYAPEEIVGRPVATLAPPDRVGEIADILRRLAAGESIESVETVRRRKDGELLEVLLSISPIRDADGRVAGASTIARDITERKHTEAALRASEARYRRIIETAEEGIWLLDTAGVTTYVNERLAAMLGRPAAEVVGRSFAEFVHPDHRAEAADHLARRRAGSPERHDFRFVRADGSDLWALVSLGAVLDDEGGWTGALAMVTDVTDRRRAEESLRFLADAGRVLARSLDHDTVLREIAQLTVPRLADLCVVLLEPDGAGAPAAWHAAHRDPSKLPLLREALESGIARPEPEGFLAAARRERRALLVEEVTPETLGRFIQGAETLRLSAALEPRSLVSVPLAVEDRSVGVMLLATTDPARRLAPADAGLAEELARRAAAAVENARLHAAEHDARRAAERSAGWISRLQAVTAALSEARTPEEVGQAVLAQTMPAMGAAAGWVGQLDGGGTRIDLAAAVGFPDSVVQEFRSVPLDAPISLAEAVRTGQIVCIENRAELERRYPGVEDRGQRARFGAWAVAPLWVEGRPVGGLVLNFADERRFDDDTRAYLLAVGRQSALAMERARLYDAERRARAEAEEANRAKFEFLTTMSHELRTPLNAIAGYVDLLELEIRGPITAEQRSDLARIRRSQTHLLGLINDVLNFARIETGHVNFTLQDLPADEVLAEVEPLIAPQVAARGVTYEHRCPAPVPVLHADPEKLRQILLNLLSNAVKFTPAGGRITLVCDEDAGVVRFRVEDTGIGIPADKLSSIFEPFVQVNAGYTRTSEGTGLGLSISRDLARAMGGELTAESVEGEGSVFTLILPRGTAGS